MTRDGRTKSYRSSYTQPKFVPRSSSLGTLLLPMISKETVELYCNGDITQIENYDKAIADTT